MCVCMYVYAYPNTLKNFLIESIAISRYIIMNEKQMCI